MPGAIDELLYLNQIPLSWASTRSIINGLYVMKGFTEINCEESREGELVMAQQPDQVPIGITSGAYKVDSFSFKMLAASAKMLLETLALSVNPQTGVVGAGSYGDARWTYQLTMSEPGAPLTGPAMTMTVSGVKIEKRKMGYQKGTGALEWEFECKAISVQTFGVGGGLAGLTDQLYSLQRALV